MNTSIRRMSASVYEMWNHHTDIFLPKDQKGCTEYENKFNETVVKNDKSGLIAICFNIIIGL